MFPFNSATAFQNPPSSPNLSAMRARASSPPTTNATTTDTAVIVRLYQSLRTGLTNAQPYAPSIRTPSVVSASDMPAVNSAGKTRMDQTDRPLAASGAEMPRRPNPGRGAEPGQ